MLNHPNKTGAQEYAMKHRLTINPLWLLAALLVSLLGLVSPTHRSQRT